MKKATFIAFLVGLAWCDDQFARLSASDLLAKCRAKTTDKDAYLEVLQHVDKCKFKCRFGEAGEWTEYPYEELSTCKLQDQTGRCRQGKCCLNGLAPGDTNQEEKCEEDKASM